MGYSPGGIHFHTVYRGVNSNGCLSRKNMRGITLLRHHSNKLKLSRCLTLPFLGLGWVIRTFQNLTREHIMLAIWCLRPWVRILHSAEENNLSPFDSNIACLCQSIEINNNKHIYLQNQVRKPTGSGVEWAECSLIIGTGYRILFFFRLDPR